MLRLVLSAAVCLPLSVMAQARPDSAAVVPVLAPLIGHPGSELADVVDRFATDRTVLNRRYDADDSPDQRRRMRALYTGWQARLTEVDFAKLSQEGRVDYVLLARFLRHQLALLDRRDKMRAAEAPLLPFADTLLALQDARRSLATVDPPAAARVLAQATRTIDSLRALFEPPTRIDSARVTKTVANRAADDLDDVRAVVGQWFRYYDGYDPVFSWWVKDPCRKVDEALTKYARTLRERVVGMKPSDGGRGTGGGGGGGGGGCGGGDRAPASDVNTGPIVGEPIGADGLKEDLDYEMIPYTPDELIAIAKREYAFSLAEIKKAARAMGLGDDWKAALEKVKNTYVEPGRQTDLVRDLARQAEAFFDKHDWVTIPPLAREDWRMEMIPPERQRVSPFFLGGETIQVSYPTADMSDAEKLMSMRGNNPHFSHATVFHELNPGHHLQSFMSARYNSQRRLFSTPFWNEGQSLYWEMFLWDHGFQATPEDRVGALFWRMHRSARIIFSLNFHLGKMTPDQAIQFLVDTVGFERANAEGEVRRSFGGAYSPLYQAAYMIGGLQLRALHVELVDTHKMTEREFHDAVLQGGPMPIAMVRARLEKLVLTREGAAPWRFADHLPAPVPAR
jgi:uncharacterized protein (DUF885 family)